MINTGPAIGFAKFVDHTNQQIDRTIAVYDMNRKYSKINHEKLLQKANEDLYKLLKEKEFFVEMMIKCDDEDI